MTSLNRISSNYFLLLFSLIPISIIIGPTISLINILLLDISFLFLIIKIGDFSFLKSKTLRYLFVLYLYLIFNSLVSVEISSGISRNFGFIRIIILFAALNYFFNQKFFLERLLKVWLIFFLIIVFDVYLEYFTGSNLLGFPEKVNGVTQYGSRIVSFFKNEPIVGGYINGFYLILIGFLANQYYFKQKKIIFLISLIFLIAIFFTGERSNTIKAFLGLMLFILFYKELSMKIKISLITLTFLSIFLALFSSDYLKNRYIGQIKKALNYNSQYLMIYKSGLKVFKHNPLFGVGNKNYRIETCKTLEAEDSSLRLGFEEKEFTDYYCTTHPHQIYIEFLSEHGLIGTIIIFYILYKLIFSKILIVYKGANYVQIGSMIFLLTTFLPMLPSGAFFSDYAITIFGMNLAIFYASNEKNNIFNK